MVFLVLTGCQNTAPTLQPLPSPENTAPTPLPLASPMSTVIPLDPLDYGVVSNDGPPGSLFRLAGDSLHVETISSDGGLLLSRTSGASGDTILGWGSTILVWDARSRVLHSALSYSGEGPAAISPDCSVLAFADEIDVGMLAISLNDPLTGEHILTTDPFWTRVISLDFDPTGSYLLISYPRYADVSTDIWDTSTWQHIQTLEGIPVLFSQDGGLLITRHSPDMIIEIWNATNWQRLRTIDVADRYQHTRVLSAISLDGSIMAIPRGQRVGEQTYIDLWNLETGEYIGSSELELAEADSYLRYIAVDVVAFQPNSHILGLLVSTRPIQTGNFMLLDSFTGNILYQRIGDNLTSMSFSADGSLLALGAETGDILLLNASTGQVVCQLAGHNGPVGNLFFNPDGTTLVSDLHIRTDLQTGDLSAGEIIVWDLATCR